MHHEIPQPGPTAPVDAEQVLACVASAYDRFFGDMPAPELFATLLQDLLTLTGCRLGAVAEVLHDGDGRPFLRTWALAAPDPGPATVRFRHAHTIDGDRVEVRDLGVALEASLAHDAPARLEPPADGPFAAAGLIGPCGPDGLLSVPVRRGSRLVGHVALAPWPARGVGGAEPLGPLVQAVGNLIEAYRAEAERLGAQRALARSERTLGVLVANISDILTILEPDGSWRYSSATGGRVLGYRAGFDPPGGVFSLVHPDDVETAQRAFAEVLAGERRPDEPVDLRVRAAGGEYRIFETVGVNLVHDPAVAGVVLTCHDVTAARTLEARKQEMLEADRAMRIAIEDQNRTLHELANLKNEFVASVSHELRTPVTAIVGFSELLQEEAGTFSAPVRESLAYIDANAQRILRLVDDLLLVGRLEARVVTMEPAELCARSLVEESVAALYPIAREAAVELCVDAQTGPALWADRIRIEQVIGNLVSNAIKFTPAGGRVEVRAERSGGAWCLVVADTGIGVPADEADRLFHRFFRASNARTETTPGTGLGLVISRAIVDLHGGTITLDSTEGEGTTVRVTLPDRSADVGSAPAPCAAA